jgi:ABC-type nitrate/sulfonate/bicarbonate transport system substrate-binding protein
MGAAQLLQYVKPRRQDDRDLRWELAMKSMLAIVLTIFVASAPTHAVAQDWEVVRVSLGGGIDALPAIVAQERGFFLQERLVASVWSTPSEEAVAVSLSAGSSDFAVVPQRTLLLMAAARLPVTVIATSNWDTELALIVPATADFKGVEGLRRQRIAIDDGSDTLLLLVRLLNHAEIALSDVAVQSLPAARIAEVFAEGLADAVLAPRYLTQPLVAAEDAIEALDHKELVDLLGIIGAQPVVVRDTLLTDGPETVQRFVNAWIKALIYINQDPDDAAHLLQVFMHRQGVQISVEEALTRLAMTRFDRYDWSTEDAVEAIYMGWAMREVQMIDEVPNFEGYINGRFSEQAWLNLQDKSNEPAKSEE